MLEERKEDEHTLNLISEELIRSYREVGAVRIENAFDEPWLTELTRRVDAVVKDVRRGRRPRAAESEHRYRDVEIEDHDGYLRLINILPHVPSLRDFIASSRAPALVAALTGARVLRFGADGTFLKEGNAPETATPWHNDECTYSFVGEQQPSLWIALTDVDLDNSPLTTLAGSNHDAWRYHSPFSPQEISAPPGFHPWSELLERVRDSHADIRVWTARRGDAILLHPKTIHASLPRRSEQQGRRLAFSVRWMGSDVTWAPTTLTRLNPYDHHPAMRLGEPPPEVLFPIVWRAPAPA